MKASAYNYIVPNGDKTIFFNGISESFFEIPNERAEIYAEIIHNPASYTDDFQWFLDRMIDKGFVLDDDTDEDALLEKKFRATLSENLLHVMILPTYQCNLRCWYCVQNHKDMTMSDETVEQVKGMLAQKIKDSKITDVRISWFGGEPLLGYDTIIDITSYVKRLTSDYDKSFICDITTNGTLLNRERIKALREAGVTSYQITIDGDKETHDSIKVLNHGSAYDTTVENINIITETTRCTLRFNYTHDNLRPQSIVDNLTARLKPENRHNITFLLYKVWQEPQDRICDDEVESLITLSNDIGIVSQLPTCNLCYADCTNFNCIFPNGNVGKCDNESPMAAKGSIDGGDVTWSGDISAHTPAFLNHTFPCRKCRYVPICWGPCVAKRAVMLNDDGLGHCQYADKDDEMKRFIINRCSNLKRTEVV